MRRQSATAAAEYHPRTLYGVNFLRIALPVNRPIRKQRKPNEARFEAALLLKPSAPFRCVSNQPAKNPEAGASGGCHEVGIGGTCDVMELIKKLKIPGCAATERNCAGNAIQKCEWDQI